MSRTANVRVLHIEDDLEDQSFVVDLLADSQRTRFTLESVETGDAAREKLKRERFDVILLDYLLPDTTGLAFMEWLQASHYRVPVVLVTSHGDTRLQLEALEAGFCEYLEKGTFNGLRLERTLLFAIGLHDRQNAMPDTNGVGMLIQELVGLTRESVLAQTKAAHETAELRNDLKAEVSDLRSDISTVLREVKKTPWEKLKELLNWGVEHPKAIAFLIFAVLLLVSSSVLLVNLLDTEKFQQIRGGQNPAPAADSSEP